MSLNPVLKEHLGLNSNSTSIYILLLLLSRFSRVRLCAPHGLQPSRLLLPWDSPGKNIGVGCRFLLQCMKVESASEVAQSCPTLSDPMDCSLPGSSIHGIFQETVLEWGAIAFSHFSTQCQCITRPSPAFPIFRQWKHSTIQVKTFLLRAVTTKCFMWIFLK